MIENLINEYIMDSDNATKNYKLGVQYEAMGQTASALSFFLRASELTSDDNMAYECLIRMGNCFNLQDNRKYSVKSMFQGAITLLPDRPEAYFYMSRYLEKEGQYFESYMFAELGLNNSANKTFPSLNIYYPGRYGLIFQKAVAAWWRGKGKESRQLLQYLVDNYWNDLDTDHRNAVTYNIQHLGCYPESYIYRMYDKKMYPKLRHKFPGAERIKQNFSQVYQDMFVLAMLNGKKHGTFLEIGGAGPKKGNNTFLLEKEFNWKGISVEFDPKCVEEYKKERDTQILCQDALKIDYDKLIEENYGDTVDYLQLDIEPADNTYKCLLKMPFDKCKFAVITYEHDYYADFTRSYRDKSRKYLESMGYVMVANDLSPDGVNTFEDWWVHPDLVSPEILQKMLDVSETSKDATEYMFSSDGSDVLDWGAIDKNPWFKSVVFYEIFEQNVYEKFVPVKENDVVLDIGASIGPFAWSIKHKKPSKVVCVEPHKGLFETLQKNVGEYTLVNKAIGAVDGHEFQLGLFDENTKETHDAAGINVETITFNTLLKENNIEHVNFMKVDCEGGEYDIFTPENFEFIKENVDYIVGEWHLTTDELRKKFRDFRDNYLSKFEKYSVFSIDDVDIKHSLFSEWFLEYYKTINVYIDNRKNVVAEEPKKKFTIIDNTAPREKRYIKDKWKYSVSPTLEFTTIIPEKGCVVDCVFCPQRTLVANYKGERRLSLENFKKAVDKLPKEVRVTFSGFVEPWMNSDCTEMVLYAHETGHPVSVFTTLVGMRPEDLDRIKHIPFAGAPNGGFTVHLPDQELRAKHPITKRYIETVEHLAKIRHEIRNFSVMSMGTVHEKVVHVFPDATVYKGDMYSRAGNLIGERILKPELNDQKFMTVDHGDKQMTCGCDERLYHNVMLPNGDVSLCCMDYGVEEITGNIFESDYNDVIPDPYEAFMLCRKCENAISIDSAFIKAERKSYGV